MRSGDDEEAEAGPAFVEVPLEEISPDVLRALVESFVNREGTDYGSVEKSLDEKVADVLRQLEGGEARVVFDPESESINIIPSEA